MINEERLVQLFKTLCLINAPALEERASVDYVKQYLTEIGLEVSEDHAREVIGGNAGNVIALLKGTKPGAPRIYLSAHFDTVEPTAGLVLEENNGVYSSGTNTILGADDKGGMAPAIEAVHAIMESKEPHGDVYLLLSVAEEIGLKGAGALKIEELNLDFGYVLDTGPPVGSFVNRTANHDKLDVEIFGKPAHAGKDPEHGINSIQVLADAVQGMKLGRIDSETTSNIGLIEGGTGVNVVCAYVKIRAEARSTDVSKLAEQIAHMKSKFEEAGQKWGAEIKFDHSHHYSSYQIHPGARVIEVAQRASASLGFDPALRTTLGGSDANVYNAKGVPSIVVATGMEFIHTHEERISRVDLINTAKLAYALIVEAAK